uniref:Uncharacterized protein n=1 Tax=Physcomitrium patens TaxID=3218 RepID=A0A2K1KD87_PHYPA|nr:hypothetical protein PHYPA_010929 [Physcomitrium patens]
MKYVFFIEVGAISWNYKRQPTIERSTIEVEYMIEYYSKLDSKIRKCIFV